MTKANTSWFPKCTFNLFQILYYTKVSIFCCSALSYSAQRVQCVGSTPSTGQATTPRLSPSSLPRIRWVDKVLVRSINKSIGTQIEYHQHYLVRWIKHLRFKYEMWVLYHFFPFQMSTALLNLLISSMSWNVIAFKNLPDYPNNQTMVV